MRRMLKSYNKHTALSLACSSVHGILDTSSNTLMLLHRADIVSAGRQWLRSKTCRECVLLSVSVGTGLGDVRACHGSRHVDDT